MESRGPEDSKNVKTSQAYFLKGSSHYLKISPWLVGLIHKTLFWNISVYTSLYIQIFLTL